MNASMRLRLAAVDDLPAIQALIPLSVRGLNAGHSTPAQLDVSLRHVFGADTQIVRDGRIPWPTRGPPGVLAACGGWSRRRTLYGGDQMKGEVDPLLDPAREPARIRAFFVHPDFARRGLGRHLLETCLLETCAGAARAAGFRALELGSTLPGVALHEACGSRVVERLEQPTPGGLGLPLVRMRWELEA